jgi:hypothetical protein
LLEICRGLTQVPYGLLQERRLSVLQAPTETILADCTSSRAAGFGVTGAIHSTEDYDLTRQWAEAFARTGFGGIRYLVSHDPRQRLIGTAIFGKAGNADWPVEATTEIPLDLLDELERRFGILTVRYRADRL